MKKKKRLWKTSAIAPGGAPAAGPRDSTTAIYVLGARFSPLTEAARCSFRRGNAAPLVLGATRHNETTIECAPLDPTAVPSLGLGSV